MVQLGENELSPVMSVLHASRCWALKDDQENVHPIRKRAVDTTLDIPSNVDDMSSKYFRNAKLDSFDLSRELMSCPFLSGASLA